jgi:hypothetical protein
VTSLIPFSPPSTTPLLSKRLVCILKPTV